MVTINIGRKEAVFFGVVILVLAVVGFGVAAWDDNKVMYHEGVDVKVAFNGSIMSLNEALSMINAGGGFGGGGGGMSFGDWESKNSDQEYGPVTSDGFVIAYYSREINRDMQGFTGSTSGSLIMRHRSEVSTGNRESNTFTMPVKSGNYWEVTGATTVYWLPLISSGGSGGTLEQTTKHVSEAVIVCCDSGWIRSGCSGGRPGHATNVNIFPSSGECCSTTNSNDMELYVYCMRIV